MDAKLVADKQIGRDDIMEEHNVTKSIHQRLAEPFKLPQQGGDFEGAIQDLVEFDHKVESTHQGIAFGPSVLDGSAITGPEFISTKKNGRDYIMEEQSAEPFKLQQQGGDSEGAIQALVNVESTHQSIAFGPSELVGSAMMDSAITGPEFMSSTAITGPEFMSSTLNIFDETPIDPLVPYPLVPLAKQTVGDEDLLLYQQLYRYASQGKIDSFIDTIESKLEANAPDRLLSQLNPHNNTLLHIAAKFGHEKLAAKILQHHKPLLFEKNSDRDTALHIAAKAGDLDTTNTLLREAQSQDVFILLTTKNHEQNNPLHEALIHGHQSVAKCLIEAYPVLRFDCNKEQKSTLYLAAEEGFIEIVKLMQKKSI